jgi:CubicO group peptidase (beta-lactamase class C family)/D-alanyl-D-alanine dipeptidase
MRPRLESFLETRLKRPRRVRTRVLRAIAAVLLFGHAARLNAADVPAAAPYQAAIARLEPWIEAIQKEQSPASITIALVDDRRVVWARGFGLADADRKIAATSDSLARVGSVSKLFTDIALMRLVEEGKIDLDADVTTILRGFRPRNPFDKPITLKQLLAHRSGLVREPPVGHYFDSTNPTIAETVASLNHTTLVDEPGTRVKYSNAGITVVGEVIEVAVGEPFAPAVNDLVLKPLGMDRSSFAPAAELRSEIAKGFMWTYEGREFAAPVFPLGIAPAGELYSTAADLAKFLSALFARGEGERGRVLKAETLERMWEPAFVDRSGGKTAVFGLGFALGALDGKRKVGHSGAVYGYATQVSALPDEKLGAVVIVARDCANAIASRIADASLRSMIAVREKKSLPELSLPRPPGRDRARALEGRYAAGDRVVDLRASGDRLFAWPARGGTRLELRVNGNELIVSDPIASGPSVVVRENKVLFEGEPLEKVERVKPATCPEGRRGLIGEYGWDYDKLFILEKDGALHVLIEWFFDYPLVRETNDVYAFPDWGLYEREKLTFHRDASGRADRVEVAGVAFPRIRLEGDDGSTFRIKPLRPIDELRAEALRAFPPVEADRPDVPRLVDLARLDATIKFDIRYATANNFLGTPVYSSPRAFLREPAAEALLRVHRSLKEKGYGLLIHDAYRPWYVTKIFWEATPPDKRVFVADPAKGSRHNRGAAVDLTLYDLTTGVAVAAPGGYDEFSDRSYPDYPGGTSLERYVRDLLRDAMEREGFSVYEAEWWHFDYQAWSDYPILNVPFEKL